MWDLDGIYSHRLAVSGGNWSNNVSAHLNLDKQLQKLIYQVNQEGAVRRHSYQHIRQRRILVLSSALLADADLLLKLPEASSCQLPGQELSAGFGQPRPCAKDG